MVKSRDIHTNSEAYTSQSVYMVKTYIRQIAHTVNVHPIEHTHRGTYTATYTQSNIHTERHTHGGIYTRRHIFMKETYT